MVWARRLGLNLVLAVGVALVLLVPAAVRLVFRVEPELALFADAELSARLRQLVPYLTLCLAHGFAAGCLCGLLFRIPLFAGFVAFLASLLLVKLWAPSLVVGGLHWWQICGAPLLLLLTVLLLLGPWARDQLRSWSAALRLALGLFMACLWLAGALVYRVVEVPPAPDAVGVAGLAVDNRNEAALLIRGPGADPRPGTA